MRTEADGNSGGPLERTQARQQQPVSSRVEVQMRELDWPKLNPTPDGKPRPDAYVHGKLFGVQGVQGVKAVPENPRGEHSMSIETASWLATAGTRTTSSPSMA
jgi:hypothetical protein